MSACLGTFCHEGLDFEDGLLAAMEKEAEMNNETQTETGIARLYESKRAEGLVDVKFLHKNLDEGSPAQVEHDLCAIHNAIKGGHTKVLNFGDLRLKKAS